MMRFNVLSHGKRAPETGALFGSCNVCNRLSWLKTLTRIIREGKVHPDWSG